MPVVSLADKKARAVLEANWRQGYTAPADGVYPHQWLWDSCFIAMGQATYNPARAQTEIESLLSAQWQNGMIPHMVFASSTNYFLGPNFWRSKKSAAAPRDRDTSGLTQPPLLSMAAITVADHLPEAQARVWLRKLYPRLLQYHQWLYRERDPYGRGLIVLMHPWESGLDNSPYWMEMLKKTPNPLWVATFIKFRIDKLFGKFRHDTKAIPAHERLNDTEAIKLLHRAIKFRDNGYDSRRQIKKSRFLVEDVAFNSILIAANRALFDIATLIGEELPADLSFRMQKNEQALEELWDEPTGQYYSRNFRNKKLLKTPTIAGLMPLFAGTIKPERAQKLVALISNADAYWTGYPIPSVPLNSPYFDQHHYWQGPTWINTNWLIIQGLLNYNFSNHAVTITARTLKMIEHNGFYEYFSPISGRGYGVNNFSWTAALYLALAESKS